MAQNDNSDYKLPRTNILEYLPEVYQSDTSTTVIENTFNRFLTKEEVIEVSGTVGAPTNKQIQEPTVERQAFQLQPVLYSKIGTVDYVSTYNDIYNEAIRLGIDLNRLPLWGNSTKFNWVPPIDIDKLIHYLDYYWYDPSNSGSTPQYLTIKNLSKAASAAIKYYQQTTLATLGNSLIPTSMSANTIKVAVDVTSIFRTGFIFYTTSVTNSEFNNRWWKVSSSSYDENTDLSTIIVTESFTNFNTNITIDLTAFTNILQAEYDLLTQNTSVPSGSWSVSQTGSLTWDTTLVKSISYISAAEWEVFNGSPVANSLWIDTTTDTLKQYDSINMIWITVAQSFDNVLEMNTGQYDSLENIGYYDNPWVQQNKWVHKSVVPNFSVASQAQIPIIEYSPFVELNEWSYIDHTWQYRSNLVFPFSDTVSYPTLLELKAVTIDSYVSSSILSITSDMGDLTDVFIPGFIVNITDGITYEQVTVKYSTFEDLGNPDHRYQTVVTLQSAPLMATATSFQPYKTSQGDLWLGYHNQWLFKETLDPVPVSQQSKNEFIDNFYTATLSPYAQLFNVTTPQTTFNLDSSLTTVSPIGSDSLRVYYNGQRQVGNFTPINNSGYVGGVIFNNPFTTGTVKIEVGPATVTDIAWDNVPVRTVVSDSVWGLNPVPTYMDLTRYLKSDQVKYKTIQYPEFDILNINSSETNTTSRIFGFAEDNSYAVSPYVQKRIVQTTSKQFEFEQFLLGDNNKLLAYRDYELATKYWVDLENNVYIWNKKVWSKKFLTDSGYYLSVVSSSIPPQEPWQSISGSLWFDTLNKKLFTQSSLLITDYTHSSNSISFSGDYLSKIFVNDQIFVDDVEFPLTISSVTYNSGTDKTTIITAEQSIGIVAGISYIRWISVDQNQITFNEVDPTIQTIWKKGINDEEYIPQYVDKNDQPISVGDPDGVWELPNQLYYNNSHANNKKVFLTQLVTHFNTIIDNQVPPPGYIGTSRQLFHLQDNVNYGLGGTIKEYNDSYDTFLSSLYNNVVTPTTLIEFAHDQYLNALASIQELYSKNIVSYLTDISPSGIINQTDNVINGVISTFEKNDALNLIYGDSSDYDPVTKKGVINWILTLPFMKLSPKVKPERLLDPKRNISEIVHHDGHRSNLSISLPVIKNLVSQIINTPNASTTTLGRNKNTVPPQVTSTFLTEYGSTSLVAGVYWYNSTLNKLYQFAVASIDNTPPLNVPDGTLWFDITTSLLKYLDTGVWVPVSGTTNDISGGWVEKNIVELLAQTILEVETRLWEAAPSYTESAFDFSTLETEPTVLQTHEMQQFNNFIHKEKIDAPYSTLLTYNSSNAFTWNYKYSTIDFPSSINTGSESGGAWQDLYQKIYNTPYPHLEPWKLQSYETKPDWWDAEYKDTSGNRRWIFTYGAGLNGPGSWGIGMWENIRTGIVPVGRVLPDGITISDGNPSVEVPSFEFFSVNIDNVTVDGKYAPDDIFPPYWNYVSTYGPSYAGPNRSLITNYNNLLNTNFDFNFGDSGTVEWEWKVSSQYLYDQLTIAFLMQPIRFIHSCFGNHFLNVNGLQVDQNSYKVFAHQDTVFHGELINTNEIYKANGLNQWYVNYSRYSGFDIGTSNFRKLWTNWTTPLTYQFASFLDTSSFFITNNTFDITEQDYNILVKKSPGLRDYWLDSLNVSLFYAPPGILSHNTEGVWQFQVNTSAPVGREITRYGVQKYKFNVDSSNICRLYYYEIKNVDAANNTFTIDGNQTDVFTTELTFTVSDSTGNNGTWTVSSAMYDSQLKQTIIKVTADITNTIVDGNITADYREFGWSTGDTIRFSSTKYLPIPLAINTDYYVIRLSNTTFKIAESYGDALSNTAIVLTSAGSGDLYVGQISATFYSANFELWNQYSIDTNYIESSFLPEPITGIQNVIDFVNGYAAYANTQGFVFNYQGKQKDPVTGVIDNWLNELLRFINWAYDAQKTKFSVSDNFAVTADHNTNTFSFVDSQPVWGTGTQIIFNSNLGTLPAPLMGGGSYFLIRDENNPSIFQVALTASGALNGNAITLLNNGSGTFSISEYIKPGIPSFEINPFRNYLWFTTNQGIVSNVLQGPYQDIVNNQTIYDQYGRIIDIKNINVFRQDKLTNIFVHDQIPNDVIPAYLADPYNYIHIGGAHLFVDGYEHIIMFNNYSADGSFLIYDPFIGLNTPNFNMQFFRQTEFTLRPNVGGFFLNNGELVPNIEASIVNLQNAYTTYTSDTTNIYTENARKLLGYTGEKDYLSQLNINPNSQFIFWRGMIHGKGSNNSVAAFVNSSIYKSASLDEYWAYKIAEFGTNKEISYPELNLFVKDSYTNELRVQFISDNESYDYGFEPISYDTPDRWYLYPEQSQVLKRLDPLYFESNNTLLDNNPSFLEIGGTYYYQSSFPFDSVIITYFDTLSGTTKQFIENVDYIIINSQIIEFTTDPTSSIYEDKKIYAITSANPNLSPNKIIDYKSGSVVSELPVWDPARGMHYYNAINMVDLQLENDPANYTNAFGTTKSFKLTLTGDIPFNTVIRIYSEVNDTYQFTLFAVDPLHQTPTGPQFAVITGDVSTTAQNIVDTINTYSGNTVIDAYHLDGTGEITLMARTPYEVYYLTSDTISGIDPILPLTGQTEENSFSSSINASKDITWNNAKIGTTWLDTSTVGYFPYYDKQIFPDIGDRILNWGQLGEWASINVYQWTESSVAPTAWDSLAATQQGDASIPESERATGTAYTVYNKNINGVFERVSFKPLRIFKALMTSSTVDVSQLLINDNDIVNVYVNGLFSESCTVVSDSIVLTNYNNYNTQDIIDIVRSVPTSSQLFVNNIGYFANNDCKGTWDADTNSPTITSSLGTAGDYYRVSTDGTTSIDGISTWTRGDIIVFDGTAWNRIENNMYVQDYPHTEVTKINENTLLPYTTYYFWVGNKEVPQDRKGFFDTLSLKEVNSSLANIPIPYVFYQNLKKFNYQGTWNALTNSPTLTSSYGIAGNYYKVAVSGNTNLNGTSTWNVGDIVYFNGTQWINYPFQSQQEGLLPPNRYTQLIVRGLADLVGDNNRYVIRFTRDFALRDTVDDSSTTDTHTEWALMRQGQTTTIDRNLWDKITESLIGETLDGTSSVPTLDRALYDEINGTDTRYGLGDGQTFVNSDLALSTILADLQNSDNSFYPIDINNFFANYSFDTNDDIKLAMSTIYETFSYVDVNRIYFEVLNDAFSTKQKYAEIFKTSMVSLSVVTPVTLPTS